VQEKTARIAFLVSLLLLALVGLNVATFFSNKDESNVSTKQGFYQEHELGKVLPGSDKPTYYYKFYLKDASAISQSSDLIIPVTNQPPDSSLITGATVTVLNKSSFTCGDSGSDYNFQESNGLYKLICQQTGTMQIQISKSGYSTKTTSVVYYQGEIPTIYLSKYVPPEPTPPPETIKDISLPKVFQSKGSKTTDLSEVKNTAKVKNLTLDTNKATIKFNEAVNLSSTETKNKFKKLDKYIKMNKTAVIELNSSTLKVLNKKASITMKKLPWVSEPRVLVDGKEDKNVVSNIKYSNQTLTFNVKHFSTLKAAPSIKVTEPANNFEVNEKQTSIKGVVSDSSATVSAKLNNKDIGVLKVATASGEFVAKLDLVEGFNQIVIKAQSANGTTDSLVVSGYLVLKENNLYFYIIIGVLTVVAVGSMIYSFLLMRKNKQKVPQNPNPQ
jgi:hypothetical protein